MRTEVLLRPCRLHPFIPVKEFTRLRFSVAAGPFRLLNEERAANFDSPLKMEASDLTATQDVIATVALFPVWRGSQHSPCAEPEAIS
jgi:hypothetical protein